jgi:hypothetical protein
MSNTERMATEIMQSPRFKAELMKLDNCPIFGAFSAEVMEMVRAKQISQSEAAEAAEKTRALQIKNKIDDIQFSKDIESEELKGVFITNVSDKIISNKTKTASRLALGRAMGNPSASFEWNNHRIKEGK